MAPKITLATLSQKIDDLNEKFDLHINSEAERDKMVDNHQNLLVGDGKTPSISEQLRNALAFNNGIKFWLTVLGTAFIGQFIVVLGTVIIIFVQAWPLIVKVSEAAPQLIK
jgi:hypothetical protein